jgi:hypothetical protein
MTRDVHGWRGQKIDSVIYGGQSRNQTLPAASPATIEVSFAVTAV